MAANNNTEKQAIIDAVNEAVYMEARISGKHFELCKAIKDKINQSGMSALEMTDRATIELAIMVGLEELKKIYQV